MLVIPEPLLVEILASARSEAPKEVCGWLVGEGGRVKWIYAVPNVAESGFRMHPEAQLSTMREIREAGLDLVGTYHSHPRTLARPSVRDLQLGSYPDCLHLIVSLVEPTVRAFRISGGTVRDVEVLVEQTSINEPAIYMDCEEAGPSVD